MRAHERNLHISIYTSIPVCRHPHDTPSLNCFATIEHFHTDEAVDGKILLVKKLHKITKYNLTDI